eukprot:scaffold80134_cov21-Tisochrysis_lutea.AAC.2
MPTANPCCGCLFLAFCICAGRQQKKKDPAAGLSEAAVVRLKQIPAVVACFWRYVLVGRGIKS